MKAYKSLMLCLLLFAPITQAKQTKEVGADGEIEAFISADELSRIKVLNDRIKSIKANQGDMELLEDNNLGEVYLRPAKPGRVPVNMFITTEKGHTYKLLLIPQKMPSEQIFIKGKEEPAKLSGKGAVVSLIKDMRARVESAGFNRKVVDEVIDIDGNKYHRIAIYQSPKVVGEVLEFHNSSEEHFRITPEVFTNLKIQALSIDKHELNPGERTFIYVIKGVNHE